MSESCLACDLASGQFDLPGGRIHRTDYWLVEHCVGPLGVGTLIVKPERHVTHLADLTEAEALELGPLLRQTAQIVSEISNPDQVYTCLWSHSGRQAVHIHFVVQPVTTETIEQFDAIGPSLQERMFKAEIPTNNKAVKTFADQARERFSGPA